MILKISYNIIRLFLALGILFTNYSYLIETSSISETLKGEKKKQLLDSNQKFIKELKTKANKLEDSRDWIKAKKYRERILSLAKQNYGLDHSETAFALNALGQLHYSLGEYKKAEPLFKQSLEIYKKIYGLEHPQTVTALNNLGFLYRSLGKYEKAESLLNQSLEIRKRILGLEHPNTSTALGNLGMLYKILGEYEKAEPLLKKSLEINKKIFGLERTETSTALNNLGSLYRDLSEYEKAKPLYKQSLEIYKKNFGLEHPYTAVAFNNLGLLYRDLGEYEKAEPLIKQTLEIQKQIYGFEHPETAISILNLGELYKVLGEYEKAESLFNQSLEIRKRIFGLEHPDTANSLGNLGLLYKNLGKYEKAESLFNQSLEIRKRIFGLEHPDTAISILNLGELYKVLGEYEKAESLLNQSLEIRKRIYGLEHPLISNGLNNLGSLYMDLGKYEKAESLFNQSLEIRKRIFGLEHPDTASTLNNIGLLYESLGKYEDAEPLLKQSLEIRKKINGLDHPATAIVLSNLGSLYESLGKFKDSESLFNQSVIIFEKSFGLNHPNTTTSLGNLGMFYKTLGQYEKSNKLLRSSLISNLQFIKRELPFLPISSRIKFADRYAFNDKIYSNLDKNINYKELAMFRIINTKGLLEEIEKSQSQLKSLEGPQKEIANQLRIINQKISNLKVDQKQIQDFLKEKEKLEKKLYRLLPQLKTRIVNIEDLIQVMPNNSILIEYVRYFPYINRGWESPRYLALVLDPSKKDFKNGNASKYKIHVVDLGLAETIENKIHNALRATEGGLSDAPQLLKDLGESIIKPLAAINKESKTWFITPDGELNKIPFAALGGYEGDHLLVDKIKIRLLTTGRELIDLQTKKKSKKNISFVFANPSFELEKEIISKAQPIKSSFELNNSQIRSIDLVDFKWASLPGTEKEGKIIADTISARLLVEDKATAKEIINIKNPRVLHIASHSFYLNKQEKNINSFKNLLKSKYMKPLNYFANNENPLLRSGVVLAGANNPELIKDDDGYLTALEITQLDWNGTELVVVSGCDSGSGDIKNGEGIYGLKRAISVAGSKSSLLSLWKVDDQATAVFMKSYYEKLVAGEGRAKALINTQREFRNHNNENFRHPYIWAAFQLSGDWRPIDF